jgi:hypothetical protein
VIFVLWRLDVLVRIGLVKNSALVWSRSGKSNDKGDGEKDPRGSFGNLVWYGF